MQTAWRIMKAEMHYHRWVLLAVLLLIPVYFGLYYVVPLELYDDLDWVYAHFLSVSVLIISINNKKERRVMTHGRLPGAGTHVALGRVATGGLLWLIYTLGIFVGALLTFDSGFLLMALLRTLAFSAWGLVSVFGLEYLSYTALRDIKDVLRIITYIATLIIYIAAVVFITLFLDVDQPMRIFGNLTLVLGMLFFWTAGLVMAWHIVRNFARQPMEMDRSCNSRLSLLEM